VKRKKTDSNGEATPMIQRIKSEGSISGTLDAHGDD
jgi:hypothetical protein